MLRRLYWEWCWVRRGAFRSIVPMLSVFMDKVVCGGVTCEQVRRLAEVEEGSGVAQACWMVTALSGIWVVGCEAPRRVIRIATNERKLVCHWSITATEASCSWRCVYAWECHHRSVDYCAVLEVNNEYEGMMERLRFDSLVHPHR